MEETGNTDSASSSFSQEDMMQNIVAELKWLHSQRTQKFEDTSITKIAAKLSTDLRCRKSQHCAAQFIVHYQIILSRKFMSFGCCQKIQP